MNNQIPNTEKIYKNDLPLDKLSTSDALKLILMEQKDGIELMNKSIPIFRDIVEIASSHLSKNDSGRIIYCGAGTSARIGVQDGSELYPTFGWPKKRTAYAVAGGMKAILTSVEGAEDSEEAAIQQSENARSSEWFEVQVNHVEITDVECCEDN